MTPPPHPSAISFQRKLNLWLSEGILPTICCDKPRKTRTIRPHISALMQKKGPAFAGPLRWPLTVARQDRILGGLFFDSRFIIGLRLWTASRALGQCGLDFFHCFGFGDALHRRHFTRQPIQSRFVELA